MNSAHYQPTAVGLSNSRGLTCAGPFAVMIATAFIAGGAGGLIWVGSRDTSTSWYPWPSRTAAESLLIVAAAATGLAFVAWTSTALT